MLLLLYQKNESRPSPSTKLTCKDSAKNRFSEGKENIFSFLSVRFLSKEGYKEEKRQAENHKTIAEHFPL